MIQLPGGLWHNDELHREVAFKPITGLVEMAIDEACQKALNLPEAATIALAASLLNIGRFAATPSLVDDLSIGDRQFIAQQLAVQLDMGEFWMTSACTNCGEHFDFLIRFSQLPVTEAGNGYPFAQVNTSIGRLWWRVPTGADQKVLAGDVDEDENLIRILVERCLVNDPFGENEDGSTRKLGGLSDDDLKMVETALESIAPKVTTEVGVTCIACGKIGKIHIDPYWFLSRNRGEVIEQIHTIALNYHWSETEILALPKKRRRRYLKLIERSMGMV
jgi:hypothetical protein